MVTETMSKSRDYVRMHRERKKRIRLLFEVTNLLNDRDDFECKPYIDKFGVLRINWQVGQAAHEEITLLGAYKRMTYSQLMHQYGMALIERAHVVSTLEDLEGDEHGS